MLLCTVCGHDNFPFTNSQISGWASGQSLQMVEKCHQCGSRVAETCVVCDRLHPLNTMHCPIYGVSIAAFRNLEVDLETRVRIFKGLPRVKEAMAKEAKLLYWLKRAFLAVSAIIILSMITSGSKTAEIVLGSLSLNLLSVLVFLAIYARLSSRIGKGMAPLWREKNSGFLEPHSIVVSRKYVHIDFDEWVDRGDYSSVKTSLRSRLINTLSS